jgi:hypothetical protein
MVRSGFASVIAASSAPYGYTIAIWSSGAVLLDSHGKPSVGQVFMFAAGALLGFAALGLLAQHEATRQTGGYRARERVLAGVLDWMSVSAAVGSVALIALIHSWVVWPLAPLATTLIYFSAVALQLAGVAIHNRHL